MKYWYATCMIGLNWKSAFRRILFAVHPGLAIVEAWACGFVILVILRQLSEDVIPSVMGNGWFVLAGATGMWVVLRARIPVGKWQHQILWELGTGLLLSLSMLAGISAPIYILHWDAVWWTAFVSYSPLVILLLGIGPGYIVMRGLVRLWFYWDRLRRQRMLWSLTHAHLIVVVVVMGGWAVIALLLSPLQEILSYDSQSGNVVAALVSDLLVTFFPAAIAVIVVTALILAVVLPPSALLSFLVARKTTRRLEALATMTNKFRDGDYATRVAVSGEDEVAQLQLNFNTMAEVLETTLYDLETERDKVAQLLQARQVLIANVTHELRTPVATLRGYLESIQSYVSDPGTLSHDLGIMETEILHLQRLIDDLFTLSRAEVAALPLDLQLVAPGSVVRRRVNALSPLAWEREHVDLVAELPPDLPLIYVDEGRLDQILTNLLRNALRHTPPGGIIAVRAEATGDIVQFQVCDTGDGISPEDLPYIWERFYRGEASRVQDQHGAGLGLALVKELTCAMHGSVDVQSVVGEGSCFTLSFPKAKV